MSDIYNKYDKGDLVRLEVAITISGSYVDPNHVALYLIPPTEIESHFVYGVEPGFVKDAVGKYHYDHYASMYGQHVYRFQASGTAWGMEEQTFVVRQPK